jgi:tRNA-2-methylthio-N6-dimethylallyladenosine synthase
MAKSFYLETFGCQMNVVDSERIVATLHDLGYQQVDSPEASDLILLNTCSVRDKAERKVYGHLNRFKALKQVNPRLIIAVGGCVAQQEGEKILKKLPFVDLVFGTHNVHRLAELVGEVAARRGQQLATEFLDRETRLRLFPRRAAGSGIARFVTVMQGCDNFCTYCVVPLVRGREISRPCDEVLDEVRALVGQGVREITLIGQNVNSYNRHDPAAPDFAGLLQQVHAIDGIERIRFVTSHPRDLSDALIDSFASLDKLCPQLHLPVQSGSDRILTAMNRGYSVADYRRQVERLRTVRPDIRLSSDVIVGFPGETQEDADASLALVREISYADIYLFLYSPRPGTAAAALLDATPPAVKQARFEAILAAQKENSQKIWGADVGQILPVLVEGPSRRNGEESLFGRSPWNRIVNFRGDPHLIGTIVPVRIVRNNTNTQFGTIL